MSYEDEEVHTTAADELKREQAQLQLAADPHGVAVWDQSAHLLVCRCGRRFAARTDALTLAAHRKHQAAMT